MKNITPMNRVKTLVEQFEKNNNHLFNKTIFNKSTPKHYQMLSNKGIESDFLAIYKSKTEDFSFSFRFTYIDLPKEQQTVHAQIKTSVHNDSIISTTPMSLDEFKVKLKELNKIKPKNCVESAQAFANVFFDKHFNFIDALRENNKKYEDFYIEQKNLLQIDEKQHQYSIALTTKQKISDACDKEYNQLEEHQKIKALEKEMQLLKKTLTEKKEAIHEKNNFKEALINLESTRDEYISSCYVLEKNINEKFDKIPDSIKNKISPKI